MNLSNDGIKKWCIWKRCEIMRRFTSLSPILDATNICRSTAERERKSLVFRRGFTANQSVTFVSQIKEREVILHAILHCFRMHYFVAWSIPKYSIAKKVQVVILILPRNRGKPPPSTRITICRLWLWLCGRAGVVWLTPCGWRQSIDTNVQKPKTENWQPKNHTKFFSFFFLRRNARASYR